MFQLAAFLPALLPLLGKAVEKLIPDTAKQAEVMLEFQKSVLENQSSLAEAMSKVMAADANSSAFVRSARPTIVYWSLGMVTLIAFTAPFGYAGHIVGALQAVPSELWTLMTVGIGAYNVLRTVDKAVAARSVKG